MSQKNMELLEKLLRDCIYSKYEERPLEENEFLQEAEDIRRKAEALAPVDDEEFEAVKKRLRVQFAVNLDVGTYVRDEQTEHQSWLPARRAEIDPFFWNRYRKYLEDAKGWNPRVIANLGRVADEILDLCGDPQQKKFAIKGLIMGDVQSGKTANYTAICNKAADAGYHIIIVLAGIPKNLRRQTQERLDAEFSGRRSDYFLDTHAKANLKNAPYGVGRYGTEKSIASFTSVVKDFDINVLRGNNLDISNVNCPILFVVKKNKSILNNLIGWLGNSKKNEQGQIELPLLLIDDESDNASVNTHDMVKDPETEPTAINAGIRRLLKLFAQSTYLGVTATPFANIFINPEQDDDLFPSDFIYTLSAPSNYIGAEDIFGDDAKHDDMLETINDNERERCLPLKHKKTYQVKGLPRDLYEAAGYFLLTNAVRDVRGDVTAHRSMMVHISRFNDIQQQIADFLTAWLDRMRSALRNYAQLPAEEAEHIKEIHTLHAIFNDSRFHLEEKSGMSWDTLLEKYLYKAVAPVEVRAVNMTTGTASLDYSQHKKDGLRVIAIGGDALSRGLTLEGLCVTYFCRTTAMYDTLLQMGRWFGYRPHYDDLVKVWMTEEEMDWYSEITRATTELRDEIREMRDTHQTPRDFGLRVKQAPGSLIVTARNKMRTAKTVTQPISVSGRLLETPRLIADHAVLDENERIFKAFIAQLPERGTRLMDEERTHGHAYWQNVPGDCVAGLLRAFKTNPWHLSFNGEGLADYIGQHKELSLWDVVVLGKGEGSAYPDGLVCGNKHLTIANTEVRKVALNGRMLSISGTKVRVGSVGCTRIGLTRQEAKAAEAAFRAETGISAERSVPDRAFLTRMRHPILFLHIIQAKYDPAIEKNWPKFLFALGVGFPKTEDGETQTAMYVVNLVQLRNASNDIDMDTDD